MYITWAPSAVSNDIFNEDEETREAGAKAAAPIKEDTKAIALNIFIMQNYN